MTVQSFRWLRAPSREGTDVGAFAYAYPNGDKTDSWKIRELKLTQGPMRHELAVFQVMSATGDEWTRWDSGTPIQIDYGNSASNRSSFYGYLWKPDSEINQLVREPPRERAMTFKALGASMSMKEGFQKVFLNSTTSNIAQFVATQFMFDSNITPSSYVWDQLVSSGDSYFSFMVDTAQHQGYVFFVVGTTLYFIDPMSIARQQGSIYPVFYSKDAKFPNPRTYNIATIIDFKSDNAEMTEDPGRLRATWNISGVDLSTGVVFSALDDGSQSFGTLVTGGQYGQKNAGRYNLPIFDRYAATQNEDQPAVVPSNQSDASALIQNRSAINRFPIRADAELVGQANMLPMQLVCFAGLGRRNSGRWLVGELTHHVVWKNWFSTSVKVMRDSDFDPAAVGVEPAAVLPPSSIPTVLVGTQWRAKYGVGLPTGPAGTPIAVAGLSKSSALPTSEPITQVGGVVTTTIVAGSGTDVYYGPPAPAMTPASVQALLLQTAPQVQGTPTGAALALVIQMFAANGPCIVASESGFVPNVVNTAGGNWAVGLFQNNYGSNNPAAAQYISRAQSFGPPADLAANPTAQCVAAWQLLVDAGGFGPWAAELGTGYYGSPAYETALSTLTGLGWPG